MRVGLFAGCLIDFFRPRAGFAALDLLERYGCEVSIHTDWVCCGQPAYNSGDRASAKKVARKLLKHVESLEYLVVPSGSCAGMIRNHFTDLFQGDASQQAAKTLADKTWELTAFLVDVLGVHALPGSFPYRTVYGSSCSALRELGVSSQPRTLLASLRDIDLVTLENDDVCCGFGGTFSVKYSAISNHMVSEKVTDLTNQKPEVYTGPDMGCLLNIAGKLSRQGSKIDVRHIAEILAGDISTPSITGTPPEGTPPEGTNLNKAKPPGPWEV